MQGVWAYDRAKGTERRTAQELCEGPGGHPGLQSLIVRKVSMDVKILLKRERERERERVREMYETNFTIFCVVTRTRQHAQRKYSRP